MIQKAFLISFLMGATLLFGEEATHSVSPTTYFNLQGATTEQKQPKTAIKNPLDNQKIAATKMPRSGQSEVMIINPETRAKDLQEAFDYLRKMSPTSKLAVKLMNGIILSEILDMKLMTGGTMIIFRTNSLQGQKFQVVKIEDIDTITNV